MVYASTYPIQIPLRHPPGQPENPEDAGGFARKGGEMAISQELLDILACPKCKGEIRLNDTQDGLICDRCKLLYEIKDDIPIMLIDEARPVP